MRIGDDQMFGAVVLISIVLAPLSARVLLVEFQILVKFLDLASTFVEVGTRRKVLLGFSEAISEMNNPQ